MTISVNANYNNYEKRMSVSSEQKSTQVISGVESESEKIGERSADLSISKDDLAFFMQ